MRLVFAALAFSLLAAASCSQTSSNTGKHSPASHANCMAATAAGGCKASDIHDDGMLRKGTHVAFTLPTKRYAHGVLGDAIEWGGLTYIQQGSRNHGPYLIVDFELPKTQVFEDLRPRLVDLDNDGNFEIVVVESHVNKGAQLAVYNLQVEPEFALKKIASTPYIGRRNRWLAPVGAADFDGDGNVEIAYVDRPHLAKTLRLWRFTGKANDGTGKLVPVADFPGVTNHRIGEDFISGGIAACSGAQKMLVANSDWTEILALEFQAGKFRATAKGIAPTQANFAKLLNCH